MYVNTYSRSMHTSSTKRKYAYSRVASISIISITFTFFERHSAPPSR